MLRRTCFLGVAVVNATVSWRNCRELPHFDVCVIGSGPAGIAAALRAVDYKKSVCIIERERIGGRDLWRGTLHSKVLWEMSNLFAKEDGPVAERIYPVKVCPPSCSESTSGNAEALEETTESPTAAPTFGSRSAGGRRKSDMSHCVELDEEAIQATLKMSSERCEQQLLTALKAANVKIVYGSAVFTSPKVVSVHNRDTMEYHNITADYFVIATGGRPRKHPMFRIDKKRVVTSDEIMEMPIPKSIVIVGSGVIGCEFASIFARFGKTKVYLIDKAQRILPMEDKDISNVVERQLVNFGVTVHHDSVLFDLQSWEEDDREMAEHPEDPTRHSGVQYTVMNRLTGELTTMNVEKALITIGREANFKRLSLEAANCTVLDRKLQVDEYGRCIGSQHIYAVGDATGDIALVNLGSLRGKVAIDHMYGTTKLRKPAVENLSRIYFLTTAVAAVGLNEQQCQARNISYVVGRYSYEVLSRAVAAGTTEGFVKIIVSNDNMRTLLGVRAVGMNASSIVEFASLAISSNSSAYDLLSLLTAYPSASQAFQECLRMILGQSILKPSAFPDLLVVKTWAPEHYEHGRAYQKKCIKEQSKKEREEEEKEALNLQHDEEVAEAFRDGIHSSN